MRFDKFLNTDDERIFLDKVHYLYYCLMNYGGFKVGLAGGSASGKTSFVGALQKVFAADQLAVISQDNYYKPLSQQERDEFGLVNFDRPEGIDFNRLIGDVKKLSRGKSVQMIEYTFNDPSKFPKAIEIKPAPIILVEGLFVYAQEKLKRMLDFRLYIDTPKDIAKQRRLKRDLEERGMQVEEVDHQWNHHVLPAYQDHLLPHITDAHFIIENHQDFDQHLTELVQLFERKLSEKS